MRQLACQFSRKTISQTRLRFLALASRSPPLKSRRTTGNSTLKMMPATMSSWYPLISIILRTTTTTLLPRNSLKRIKTMETIDSKIMGVVSIQMLSILARPYRVTKVETFSNTWRKGKVKKIAVTNNLRRRPTKEIGPQ